MLIRAACIAIALAVAGGAAADPGGSGAQPRSAERGCRDLEARIRQADEFLGAGAFDDAIETYEALRRDCPGNRRVALATTFNIALAYKQRGERPIDARDPAIALALRQRTIEDRRRARDLYQEFLRNRPAANLVARAKADIARLEADILEQSMVATKEEDRVKSETALSARLARTRRRTEVRQRRYRRASYAAFTLSAVGLGFGTWYGVRARALSSELSLVAAWGPAEDAKVDEGVEAERRSIILSAAGGATLVAAVAFLWLSRDRPVLILPATVGAEAVGASVSGSF